MKPELNLSNAKSWIASTADCSTLERPRWWRREAEEAEGRMALGQLHRSLFECPEKVIVLVGREATHDKEVVRTNAPK
jgi:hypothetical protein